MGINDELFEKYITTKITDNSLTFLDYSFENDSQEKNDNDPNITTSNYKINEVNFLNPIENHPYFDENNNQLLFNQDHNIITPSSNIIIHIDQTSNDNHNSNNNKINKLLGRKLKNSEIKGEHDKYAENNMIRKFKVLLKDKLLIHINDIIKEDINLSIIIGNKPQKVFDIKNINQKQIINTNVEENIEFLNKPLKEIFSVKISGKYKNFPKNYNEIVIEELYKAENNQNIIRVLNKTFLECIKYFRKDTDVIENEDYACLRGLEKIYENLPEHLNEDDKNDEKFIKMFTELINNFENIFYNKKPRAKRIKEE